MFSVRKALIYVEEPILSHQLQWAFVSKIKELTITGHNLVKILPDAFLGKHNFNCLKIIYIKINVHLL